MRRVLAALAALLPAAAMAATTVTSGAYENTLMIAVDPATSKVTGYFSMTQDGPPVISCIFYLKGQLVGGKANVDSFFTDSPKDDLIKGVLSSQGAGKVRLTLPTEHGGCGNVWSFADKDNPADFALDKAHPWTSVRVVKSAKAYFYLSAGAAAHGKAYVVADDGVGVTASKPGWVQADYTGGARVVSGWLKESDLYPAP